VSRIAVSNIDGNRRKETKKVVNASSRGKNHLLKRRKGQNRGQSKGTGVKTEVRRSTTNYAENPLITRGKIKTRKARGNV